MGEWGVGRYADGQRAPCREKTYRLTSGANLPPRLLISWMMLMTMIGFGREGGGGRSGEMAKDGMSAGAEADEAKTCEGTSRGARCLHVTFGRGSTRPPGS